MTSSEKKERPLVVPDKLLQALAGELTEEWLDLARNLGLSDSMLYDTRTDNIGHVKEARYQMLLCWKRKQGQQATHSVLAEALSKAGRSDLSEKLRIGVGLKRPSGECELSLELASHTSKMPRTTEEPYLNWSAVLGGDVTSPMNEKKGQFVTELKNKYRYLCGDIQPVPFLRDRHDIAELFVEIGIKFLEEKHGESEKHEKWAKLEDYKRVFTDPSIKSKRRIIDGEPGYGKSTLALQIAHDWCQEKAPMKEFQVLILLRLRQFRNVPTIYSAIRKFLLPKDSKLTEDDIRSILDSSSTLILLDGHDEYPDREEEDTDIAHIIRGDMLQEHEVILITRTSFLPPDHSNATIKRLRLTGFDHSAREMYIRNVVARGNSEVAGKISTFLKVNPVPADLCRTPLFFTMISYMVKNSDTFRNLKTVTHFFRHIIKCFHSHHQIKGAGRNKEKELDHSKLNIIAFKGLSGDTQQISWDKDKLIDKVGKDLYDEYIRIGILVEEEGFDYEALEYNTETRFFHKLFAEWYAAHYFAKVVGKSETEFEPWQKPRNQAAGTSQQHQAANDGNMHMLKSLNPTDVHYMYRYACGWNPVAALKIINHLGTNTKYDHYTMLCITEWGGSLETILTTVKLLCSRQINISETDSLLLKKSAINLIEFASSQKIRIRSLFLDNCLDVGRHGQLSVTPTSIPLPVINTTLTELSIYKPSYDTIEEETYSILQYAAKCIDLCQLAFWWCLIPRYIKVSESYISALKSREVEVRWVLSRVFTLNFETGEWEHEWLSMTDKQYQEGGGLNKLLFLLCLMRSGFKMFYDLLPIKFLQDIVVKKAEEIRRMTERWKKRLGKDSNEQEESSTSSG